MSDPDTHWEMARGEAGRGQGWKGDGRGRGLHGVGSGVPQAGGLFHSALARSKTAAATEARAPVPGILARILKEKQVESRGGAREDNSEN